MPNTNQAVAQNDARPGFGRGRGSVRFSDPNNKSKQCYICGSFSHLRAQCDRGGQQFQRVNASTADQSHGQYSLAGSQQVDARPIVAAAQPTSEPQPAVSAGDGPVAGVNKVAVAAAEQLGGEGEGHLYSGSWLHCFDTSDDVLSCDMQRDDYYTDGIVALFADLDDAGIPECSYAKTKDVNVSEQFDIHRIVADCQAAMHYVQLNVADAFGNAVKITSLFDSGTQISILKADAVEKLSCTLLGKVTLQTFDNRVSTGDLVSLNVRLDGGQKYHPIRFVVCANVSHDCLLSLADYRKLLDSEACSTESEMTAEVDESVLSVANVDNDTIDSADSNQPVDCGESNADDHNLDDDDDVGKYANLVKC